MPADDDSDAPPPPKKQETKKVVPKKTTAEKKAVDPAALEPAPPSKSATGKTKKISKGDAPAAKPPGDDDAPAEKAEGDKPKKATGAVKKPLAKSDGKLGGKPGKPKRERPAGPPPAPPAVRGPIDYVLGVLSPIICAGLGAYAFLLIKGALDRCSNPILSEYYANPAQDIPAVASWATAFAPAPICVGAVVGLLATLCFLKMAPGLGARLMGGGMLGFGILATIPFMGAGTQLQGLIKATIKKSYAMQRGADVDPRALDLTVPAAEYAKRHFTALWAIDMDGGDMPLAFVAMSDDPGLPTGDKVPAEESKIKNADLRDILARGRGELAGKVDEALWKKIQKFRDDVNNEISTPSEDAAKLDEAWKKFEGRAKGKLAKPPKPKGGDAWFSRYTTWADAQGKQGIAKDDCAFYQKKYFCKALRAAVKEIPADMRYAGCFRAEVKDEAPADGLTRYNFVWVCYDLEQPEREPIVIPHIKGVLDEARFKIEVVGDKAPEGLGKGAEKPAQKSDEKPEKPAEKPPEEKPAEKPPEEKPAEKPPEDPK